MGSPGRPEGAVGSRAALGLAVAALACAALACDPDEGTADGPAPGTPGTVTLLGEIHPSRFCDTSAIVDIVVRATQVGCEPGPPAPCTMPAEPPVVEGDVATCPANDPTRLLGVDLTRPGRYRVEAVGRFTTGEETTACFLAEAGDALDGGEIAVTQEDLDAGVTIEVVETDAPCG